MALRLTHLAKLKLAVEGEAFKAGAAWDGEIGSVDSKILRQSFELNFWSHQTVAQETVKIMTKQKTGGCLLLLLSPHYHDSQTQHQLNRTDDQIDRIDLQEKTTHVEE